MNTQHTIEAGQPTIFDQLIAVPINDEVTADHISINQLGHLFTIEDALAEYDQAFDIIVANAFSLLHVEDPNDGNPTVNEQLFRMFGELNYIS